MRFTTLLLASLAVGLLAPLPLMKRAEAQGAHGDIMKVKDVKAGMKGYGLTVFEGTKPEKFDVEVIDVLPNFRPRQELILIKTKHPRLEVAKVVAGMSGSPIYLNGKMIGAYAYGWTFGKEPVAGVTPIENMLGRSGASAAQEHRWLAHHGAAADDEIEGEAKARKARQAAQHRESIRRQARGLRSDHPRQADRQTLRPALLAQFDLGHAGGHSHPDWWNDRGRNRSRPRRCFRPSVSNHCKRVAGAASKPAHPCTTWTAEPLAWSSSAAT